MSCAAREIVGLMTDADGLTFAHMDAEEATFLYEEIFVRQAYLQHGVTLSRKGAPVVLDVGANIGLFSMFCLRVNPRAHIIAVEPSPSTFDVLESNLAGAPRAHCVCAALGAAARSSRLHCYTDAPGESSRHPRERLMQRRRLAAAAAESGEIANTSPAASITCETEDSAHSVHCEIRRGDALLCEMERVQVDLLKIDVEGDELDVLRGMGAALRDVRQVVLEVHDINGRLWRALCLLRRYGFRAKAVPQRSSTVEGYHMFVPDSLRLFYVYATRPATRRTRSMDLRRRR